MKTYITLLAIASLVQSGAGAPRSEAGHLQARSNQASGGGGGGIGDDIGGSIDGSALGSANGSNVGGGSNGGGAGGNGGGAGGDLVGTSGNPIPVVVGGPQDLFVPNLIRAQIGQTIQFQFSNGNHTVTQGKDSAGCAPITKEELKGGAEPVHSGHLPFKDGDQNVGTFDVRINSTDPILLYCATGNHCMTGQVMVINPSDEGQLIRYQKISQEVKENIDSGAPTGGTVGQIPLAKALFAPAPPKKAKGTPGVKGAGGAGGAGDAGAAGKPPAMEAGKPSAGGAGGAGKPPAMEAGEAGKPPAMEAGEAGKPPAMEAGGAGKPPAAAPGGASSPIESVSGGQNGSPLVIVLKDA
ncbi:hypothetical protein ED733_007818 [Metarhizium rileyi]|uniref:Extracellular serine-rich protein n=1 Tax=Metarhizium rileyi (strain RCEF 4871) TaxID=1649241 RepID=A0A5C6GFA4_METRR|nr:hypothetical protein ED733_007818 [Metarhizium rileyi]